MIGRKPLVLDANVLMRAVLGVRARQIIKASPDGVALYAPDVAFRDAHRYLPSVAATRALDAKQGADLLDALSTFIEVVDYASYTAHQVEARDRIAHRDPEDWPIIATALMLAAPIWTEDQDFFGCGVATWITATVELYFRF